VGRLDAATTGIILLSSDGELTHRLTHPRYGIEKTYVARLEGELSKESLERLNNGVELDDGMTAPAKAKILAQKPGETLLELIIHEGRNRQVRRMCSAVGNDVISLHRSQVGPITDRGLKSGESRQLSTAEVHELYKITNL
jgi:23S rRNA pseudouridine2605 synthase